MRLRISMLLLLCAGLASGRESGSVTARAQVSGPVGLRHPTLSPDGGTILFAWRGDLWRVPFEGGLAAAVTRTPEDERRPLVSRDGTTLIYAAAAEGNFDLFALDLSGGSPRRLTWDEADDFPCDTSPDDALVLFQSRRAGGEVRLHEVSLHGGEVREVTFDSASEGRYAPDGTRIAFVHGGVGWWRKGYRGSANNDLWLLERAGRETTRITSFAGSDLWPLWLPDGRSLLCVSEETIVANLFRLDLESGERERLTRHTGDGVRFPSISRDGKRVVYEESGQILALELDPRGGAAREVEITLPEEDSTTGIDTLRAGAEELAVAAGRVVLGLEGDLFLRRDDGAMTSLTTGPGRDREPSLSRDGRTLFYASDRSGNYDLYRVDLDAVIRGETTEPRPFRTQREDERAPKLSPDGRMVAYLRTFNGDELRLADAEGGRDRLLALGPRIESFAWSPDGRWLAFSRADDAGRFDLFLLAPWGRRRSTSPDIRRRI
ncbi:MAG: PD40 domain-containing protein [Candidatus Eisenbacteria bacterium]|nr:PD40 domain-containing protein [Candidatus Eisenbacteria bacterium]